MSGGEYLGLSGCRQNPRLGGSAAGQGWASLVRIVAFNLDFVRLNLSKSLTVLMRNYHSLLDMKPYLDFDLPCFQCSGVVRIEVFERQDD